MRFSRQSLREWVPGEEPTDLIRILRELVDQSDRGYHGTLLPMDRPTSSFNSPGNTPTSLTWKDKEGRYEVKSTQGLTVSLHTYHNWTVPSGAWTHRRVLFRGKPEELVRLFHSDRTRQETLEKPDTTPQNGQCCDRYNRYMEQKRLTDPTSLDTGYEGPCPTQDEGKSSIFWGDNQGPVVMVWDGMLPGELESVRKITRDEDDWLNNTE